MIDATFVEDLQQLVEAGCSQSKINELVGTAADVTLTGIVELGCLRWKFPTIPKLSTSLMSTGIGRSISDAISRRHENGSPALPLDLTPRDSEFCLFSTEADIESQWLAFFGGRFAKSAQASGFSKPVSHCLQAGLHEMMDNAVRHSRSPARVIAGYRAALGIAEFVVADVGNGVLATLRENAKYQHLHQHSEAIRLALHDGVSSHDIGGRGFNDLFKALTSQWGLLRFRSGNGCVTIDGRGSDADSGTVTFPPHLPGFQVSVICQTR